MTDAAKTRHPTTDLPHTKENLSDRSQDDVRLDAGLVFTRRDTGDLLLDLYRPLSAGAPVPVIVWLHGGGWFTGDRTLAPDLAQHVAEAPGSFSLYWAVQQDSPIRSIAACWKMSIPSPMT